MSGAWKAVEALLADRIGLDARSIGPNLVRRAVELRLAELEIASADAYLRLLETSEVEVQALIEDVVIPESWFFRDETPFRLLRDQARTGWLANPARPPLRALSVPCAAGEEPYSLVIALRDAGLAAGRFVVDAVDVSVRRLEQARLGVYSMNAFRGGDLSFRERYFRPVPRGFELVPEVREQVRFLQGSILDPGLLAAEPRYDFVFCRNLLIYLAAESRGAALATLDRLLAPDGLLVIGHADRLVQEPGRIRFAPVGDRAAFAYHRVPSPNPSSSPSSSLAQPERAALPAPPRRPGITAQRANLVPGRSVPRPTQDASPPPSRNASAPPAAPAGAALMEQAARLANQGRHRQAIAVCEQSLRVEGPRGDTYYLMGMIHQTMGQAARAVDCFHKAIYLDPNHDEALLALALTAERRGDAAAAAGFRRRAERASTRKGVRGDG